MTTKLTDPSTQLDLSETITKSRRLQLDDGNDLPLDKPSRATLSRAQSVRSRAGAGTVRGMSPSAMLANKKPRTRTVIFDVPTSTPRSELVRAATALGLDTKGSMIQIRSRLLTWVQQNFKNEVYMIPELKGFWLQGSDSKTARRGWIQPAAHDRMAMHGMKVAPEATPEPVDVPLALEKGKEAVVTSRKTLGTINPNSHASFQDEFDDTNLASERESSSRYEDAASTSTPIHRVKAHRLALYDSEANRTSIEEKFAGLFAAPRAPPTSPTPPSNDITSWEAMQEQKRTHQAGIEELNNMLKTLAKEMRDIDDVLVEQSAEMVANRADLDTLEQIAENAFHHCEKSRDVLTDAAERIERFKREGNDLQTRIEHVTLGSDVELQVLRDRFFTIQRSAHDALETVKRNHKRLNVAIAGIPMTGRSAMEDASDVLKKLHFIPLRGQYAAWRRYGDREDGLPFDENQPPFLIIRFATEFIVMDLLKAFNAYRNHFPDRKAPFKIMKDLTKKQVLDAKRVNEIIVKWRKEDGRDYRNRDGVIYLFENNNKVRKIGIDEGPLGRDQSSPSSPAFEKQRPQNPFFNQRNNPYHPTQLARHQQQQQLGMGHGPGAVPPPPYFPMPMPFAAFDHLKMQQNWRSNNNADY